LKKLSDIFLGRLIKISNTNFKAYTLGVIPLFCLDDFDKEFTILWKTSSNGDFLAETRSKTIGAKKSVGAYETLFIIN